MSCEGVLFSSEVDDVMEIDQMTLAESTAIPEFVRVALKARMQCLALNTKNWVCGDCVCMSLCVLACKAYIVDSIQGSWALQPHGCHQPVWGRRR